MGIFATLMLCWIVFVLVRMSFRNIIGRQPQLPATDAQDVRVEMVGDAECGEGVEIGEPDLPATEYMELQSALDRITPAPYYENPGVDIPGFPFSDRAYPTFVRMDVTEAGEVFECVHCWMADDDAVDAFMESLPGLLACLPEDVDAHVERSWLHGVNELPPRMCDYPYAMVRLVRHPPTPSGRRPRHPWGIGFIADEEYSDEYRSLDVFERIRLGREGLRSVLGNIDYMADGTVGRLELVHWCRHVATMVKARLIAGELAVTEVRQKDMRDEQWWNPPRDD